MLESILSISPFWLYKSTSFFAYEGMCLSALHLSNLQLLKWNFKLIVIIYQTLLRTSAFPMCDLCGDSSGLYGSLVSNEQILDPLGQSESHNQVKMYEFLINIMIKCITHKDPHQVQNKCYQVPNKFRSRLRRTLPWEMRDTSQNRNSSKAI